MNKEQLMTVLVSPHISEKSTNVAEKHNQMVFKVRRDADKTDVKRAVELMFDVEVTDVTTANSRGKVKRFGQVAGRRNAWKKAYVTLAEGQDIDLMGAE
ncbi:MAG TPA: 50S ribosomal protein L23 [Gammaproteobacteria bacterium]|nr:50S ribosomal protein L23 [Gammaproteobacteria bacterium]